jgi:branched-subunit amino acid transport protein
MIVWAITIPLGIGTYAMRAGFILLGHRHRVPQAIQRALNFVPSAILAALVIPALVLGGPSLSFSPTRLAAGILAAFVAWRFRHVLLSVAVGMVSLWVFQAIR